MGAPVRKIWSAFLTANMSLPFPNQFPKKCTKCGKHYSKQEWSKLPPPDSGRLHFDDGFDKLEFRNCSCNGTMAVIVERHKQDPDEVESINMSSAQTSKYREIASKLAKAGHKDLAKEVLSNAASEDRASNTYTELMNYLKVDLGHVEQAIHGTTLSLTLDQIETAINHSEFGKDKKIQKTLQGLFDAVNVISDELDDMIKYIDIAQNLVKKMPTYLKQDIKPGKDLNTPKKP